MKKILTKEDNSTQDNSVILNGPLNYIELCNSKTNQNMWLFMDSHQTIVKQRKCDDYEAKDIDKFLYKIMTDANTTETLDFFLEINPTDVRTPESSYKNEKYILEVRKMFRKIYREQEKTHKYNVRLHYIDVRDYAYYDEIIKITTSIIDNVEQYKLNDIKWIIGEFEYITYRLEHINRIIENIISGKKMFDTSNFDFVNIGPKTKQQRNIKITSKQSNQESKSNQESNLGLNPNTNHDIGMIKLLLKILDGYNDKTNKKNIVEYFNENYYEVSKELILYIENIISNLKDIYSLIDYQYNNDQLNIEKFVIGKQKKIIEYSAYYGIDETTYTDLTRMFYDQLIGLHIILLKLGSVIMDCFFLRRIIEKEQYVKNSIVYTGGLHTMAYVWFLVRKYNFEVKSWYYLNTEHLNKSDVVKSINDKINSSKNYSELFELFFPKTFNQCVKISK